MFEDLWLLIRLRERSSPFGKPGLKLIAKRLLTFPSLTGFLVRKWWLVLKGARVGQFTMLSSFRMQGRGRNLCIGNFCVVGSGVYFRLNGRITIGNSVIINDGVNFMTGTHDLQDPYLGLIAKETVIEDYAWICTDSQILPGVRIGRGAVVGAGAVVSRDVPPYAVAVGNPARPTRTQRTSDLRYVPSQFFAAIEAWLGKTPLEVADLVPGTRNDNE